MSQNTKQDQQKKPKTNQVDKKNTDAWKQKQALKKKEKDEKEATGQPETKQDKKQKKKKQKAGGKQQPKQEQAPKDKKAEQTSAKKEGQKSNATIAEEQKPVVATKKYKKLQTVQTLIVPKYVQLLENRNSQIDLIEKQVLNLIRPEDTILYLSKQKLTNPQKLSAGCGRNNYKLIQIPGFTSHPDSQIVCRYEDISYLISQQIDKIFIQGVTIFQNGSALTPKGYQNIAILAKYYNKPLLVTSGSWNYSKKSISNYNELEQIYGEDILNKYDWIDNQMINLICMEFGAVLPSYVGYQVQQGYRGYGFDAVLW